MLETATKHHCITALLFFPAFTSADWDPLGADCGSNKSNHPH